MNAALARTIYIAGCRVRGTPVLAHLERLLESQWWSEGELEALRLERLRSLLAHARARSPFYRRYFEEHGFSTDVRSLADLRALPSIGKSEVKAHRDEIQNEGLGGRLIFSKSAGTTSVPLSFFRTADWDARHRAAIKRGYSWYGISPWARRGRLWLVPARPVDRLKTRASDILMNRFRQKRFDLAPETLEDFYRSLRGAEYLSGYSHLLYEFARFVNERHPGERWLDLKLVKGTTEKIHGYYQDDARAAYGSPIRSEYGASEIGIIAFECPSGSMHVVMEHVIVEVENDEIVATNLLSHSFPFIRYRLGDYVKLKTGFSCPCGRAGLVIEDVEGRVGSRIHGAGGKVYPSIAIDHIMKALGKLGGIVAQCQAVQRERGRLEFHVVPGPAAGATERARIERLIGEAVPGFFGGEMRHEVRFVAAIPLRGSKFLEFVSELPPEIRG